MSKSNQFKISNQHFEPESLGKGHSTSFRNEKAASTVGDLSAIKSDLENESEIQDELYDWLSNIDCSKKKTLQKSTEMIPYDGNTVQAFQKDNQPFMIKTEPETLKSDIDASEIRETKNKEKTVVNRPMDGTNQLEQALHIHNQSFIIKNELAADMTSDNSIVKSEEEIGQESMMTNSVDDCPQSKQTFVIGNEAFFITINPEFEDDTHDASFSTEKSTSKEMVSQKSTVASPVDVHTEQAQCVQSTIVKTEPKVPDDVFISSATNKATIKEESAQAMIDFKDSGTQLKQNFNSHSQPVNVKTEPNTWKEVSESIAEIKDNDKVQTAEILTQTRPGDDCTQLEYCSPTHHQPSIIKTEYETWDDIPVCSTEKKRKETNRDKYAQETIVANPVCSHTKIEQIHQIQNQSLIVKSEPVTGDDFLDSCVKMEAKGEDRMEQELINTCPVDGSTPLKEVTQLPSEAFKIEPEPDNHIDPVNCFQENDRKSVSIVVENMSSGVKEEMEEGAEIKNEYNGDTLVRIHGESDTHYVSDNSDISDSELDIDYLVNITDDSVNKPVEQFEMKPKPANRRWANNNKRKLSNTDFSTEMPSLVTKSEHVRFVEDKTEDVNKTRAQVDLCLLPLPVPEIETDITEPLEEDIVAPVETDMSLSAVEDFGKVGAGRSGRARKKSTKVLEMEEFEEEERKILKRRKDGGQKSVAPIQNLDRHRRPVSPVHGLASLQSVQKESNNSVIKFLLESPIQAPHSVIPSTLVTPVSSQTTEPKVKEKKESLKDLSIATAPTKPLPSKIHIDSISLADIETKHELQVVSCKKGDLSKAKVNQVNAKISDKNPSYTSEMLREMVCDLVSTESAEKKKKHITENTEDHGQPILTPRQTGYTVWCKFNRQKVTSKFQPSGISRRLGKLWSQLPKIENLFKCTICSNTFLKYRPAQRHVQERHSGFRHHCLKCNKLFRRRNYKHGCGVLKKQDMDLLSPGGVRGAEAYVLFRKWKLKVQPTLINSTINSCIDKNVQILHLRKENYR